MLSRIQAPARRIVSRVTNQKRFVGGKTADFISGRSRYPHPTTFLVKENVGMPRVCVLERSLQLRLQFLPPFFGATVPRPRFSNLTTTTTSSTLQMISLRIRRQNNNIQVPLLANKLVVACTYPCAVVAFLCVGSFPRRPEVEQGKPGLLDRRRRCLLPVFAGEQDLLQARGVLYLYLTFGRFHYVHYYLEAEAITVFPFRVSTYSYPASMGLHLKESLCLAVFGMANKQPSIFAPGL